MIRRLLVLLIIGGVMAVHPVFGADGAVQNDPDAMKYEFARSYITALSYMKDMDDRWNKNAPEKLFSDKKNKMILATINDLALDSSDLLIIKNYLRKYLTAPNVHMRKIAEMVVVATSREIAINHDEKKLWEDWYDLNAAGQATRPKEIDFVKTQYSLELHRKDADKDMVQASVLTAKLLVSEKNNGPKGHVLAITAQQRQKLLDKLDSFGQDTLDWGLKAGQSSLEGSIAVIREILEDSIWISIDEK